MYPYFGDIKGVTHYIGEDNKPMCGENSHTDKFVRDVYEPSCKRCHVINEFQKRFSFLPEDTIVSLGGVYAEYGKVLTHDEALGIVVVETCLGETVNFLRSKLRVDNRSSKYVWVWHEYNGSHSGCYDVFWHVADGVAPDNFEDDAVGGYVTMPHGQTKQQLDSFKKALWKGMQP